MHYWKGHYRLFLFNFYLVNVHIFLLPENTRKTLFFLVCLRGINGNISQKWVKEVFMNQNAKLRIELLSKALLCVYFPPLTVCTYKKLVTSCLYHSLNIYWILYILHWILRRISHFCLVDVDSYGHVNSRCFKPTIYKRFSCWNQIFEKIN